MKRLRWFFAIGASVPCALAACNDLVDVGGFRGIAGDAGADAEAGAIMPDAGPSDADAAMDAAAPPPRRCDHARRPDAEAPRCLYFDDDAGPFFGFDRVEKSSGKFEVSAPLDAGAGPLLYTEIGYSAAPSGEAFGAFVVHPVDGPSRLRFTVEADVVVTQASAGRSLLLAAAPAECGQILSAAVETELGERDRFFIRSGLAPEPRIEVFKDVPFHLTLAIDNARPTAFATESVFVNGAPLTPQQLILNQRCGELEVRVGIHQSSAPSGGATVRFDNVVYWNE